VGAQGQNIRRPAGRAGAPVAQLTEQDKVRLHDLEKAADYRNATATGRRPARASGIRAAATPVTSETESNDTFGTANAVPMSLGRGVMTAAINPGGDLDWFSLTATSGDTIWAHTDTGGTQIAGATSRDTVIDLIAADGTTVIEGDDDDGTGNGADGTIETGLASIIAGRTIAVTGTYYVRVRAFSATAIINPYSLYVTVTTGTTGADTEPNNSAATAQPLFGGGSAVSPGQLSPDGDEDFYSIQVTSPGTYSLVADGDPERDGTGTDLVLDLFETDGTTLLLSIDSSITGSLANPAAEGAAYSLAAVGTYYVRVRNFSATGTGTYTLMVAGADCGLVCPANITVSNDPNQCGAVVTYPPPTAEPACGTITCSPASGSFFPVGTTMVTCTAASGDECVFTVTVQDTQPPSITCPANITVSNDPNQCGAVVTYPDPAPSDNCPGATVACSPASGSFFPVGTTTVSCTTTDVRGNTATCSFTVTVNDTQPPSISCPPNQTVFQDSAFGGIANFPPPTNTDNCPGVTMVCSRDPGTNFPLGTTTVVCVATDGAGNTATCSFTVTVVPPPSTRGVRALGAGVFPVPPGRASFDFNVRVSGSGVPSGKVFYRDQTLARLFKGQQITAVVVTGNSARVFGKGILQGRRAVDFVMDIQDVATPGSRRDRFRLELSTGYTVGFATLQAGDIMIRPAP